MPSSMYDPDSTTAHEPVTSHRGYSHGQPRLALTIVSIALCSAKKKGMRGTKYVVVCSGCVFQKIKRTPSHAHTHTYALSMINTHTHLTWADVAVSPTCLTSRMEPSPGWSGSPAALRSVSTPMATPPAPMLVIEPTRPGEKTETEAKRPSDGLRIMCVARSAVNVKKMLCSHFCNIFFF